MESKKIHIIIPVLNGWQQTKICLDTLRSSLYSNIEIVIVDHGSTDGTKENLRTLYPETIHILAEPTLWWAGATNIGIKAALSRGATDIILLNNDCYVTAETIGALALHARQVGEAIIAPIQKSSRNGNIIVSSATTCFLLGFPTLILPRIFNSPKNKKLKATRLIMGGRGVLIPASVFKRIGLFDEINLPHYGADHDFYLRCRKQGVPLFIANDAFVCIDDSRTTLASRYANMRSAEFIETLKNRRSHRNIRDLNSLFRLHYPIKGFHYVGVMLNLARYMLLFIWGKVFSHNKNHIN